MASNIITLTTDFGIKDEFVAVMKGVVLSIHPSAVIIDVTHDIPPGNIETASFMIENVYPYYPEGAVHMMVVDPGVGSSRKVLVLEMEKQLFVGPDNGLFTRLFLKNTPKKLFSATNRSFFRPEISNTFHGRDVFAPLCAHLSKGVSPDAAGDAMSFNDAVFLKYDAPLVDDEGRLVGRVLNADHFGNITTNIHEADLIRFTGSINFYGTPVMIKDETIIHIQKKYADVPEHTVIALINSRKRLEIAVNGGSASINLGLAEGGEIKVLRQLPETDDGRNKFGLKVNDSRIIS